MVNEMKIVISIKLSLIVYFFESSNSTSDYKPYQNSKVNLVYPKNHIIYTMYELMWV